MNYQVVYLHKNSITGEVFYVGSGAFNRPYVKSGRTKAWHEKVKEVGRYEVEIYKSFLRPYEALQLEAYLIKIFGRKGLDKCGTLVNRCQIGNSQFECNLTLEARTKISDAHKGKSKSENHKNAISGALMGKVSPFKGSKHSDETKLRMSEKRKNRTTNESTRLKMSLAHKGKACKRIINITNGHVYESLKAAKDDHMFSLSYLSGMLNGKFPNKTNLEFL